MAESDVDRYALIEAVLAEMGRVWPDDSFGGSAEEYAWLLKHFGISEEEDVKWQFILQDSTGDLPEEDAEDPEVTDFLDDDEAVCAFLAELLEKYKSSTLSYRGEP